MALIDRTSKHLSRQEPEIWLEYEEGMDEDEWVMANSMTQEEYEDLRYERDGTSEVGEY
jgi:hypothetical protein